MAPFTAHRIMQATMNTMRVEIMDLLATMMKEVQRWCRVLHPLTSGDGRGHVALLLCLIFLAVLLRTAWLSDDALITFRTVLNFTHGYGLTFNVAERVQAYTHPLWMLMLTGGVPGGRQRVLRGDRPVGGCLLGRLLVGSALGGHQRAGLDRRRGAPVFPRVRGLFDVWVSRTRCRICCLSPSSRSCSARVRHALHPRPA